MIDNRLQTDIVGTAQGSIISPILSNIYLHELDKFIERIKEDFDAPKSGARPRNNETIRMKYRIQQAKKIADDHTRLKTLRELIVKYRSITNKVVGKHTQKLMYIRYADDWIVAINGSYSQTVEIYRRIKEFCKEELSLTVSEEKTKITNAYKDHILFLGTHIRHTKTYTYSMRKGVLQRNRRGLILTAPMNRIVRKFKDAGYTRNGRGRTRTT